MPFIPIHDDNTLVLIRFQMVTVGLIAAWVLALGGNMLFLWVFGDNIEDAISHWRFLPFYFLSAAAVALTQTAVDPTSQIPMIGASGAVAGVLGAYLMLHPRRRMLVLIFKTIPLRLHVGLVLVIWIVIPGECGDLVWWRKRYRLMGACRRFRGWHGPDHPLQAARCVVV